MSSAKRRRIRETGALPGRKPGTRATRANSLATRSIALVTSSAGISRSSSRRQLASAMQRPFEGPFFILLEAVGINSSRRGSTGEKSPHSTIVQYRRGVEHRQLRELGGDSSGGGEQGGKSRFLGAKREKQIPRFARNDGFGVFALGLRGGSSTG